MKNTEEQNILMSIAETRRELNTFSKTWERSNNPLLVSKEEVEKLNKLSSDFENKFKEYEKIKNQREEEERINSHIINVDSAKHLNEIYNELNKLPGVFDLEYDYEEDRFNTLEDMNRDFSVKEIVSHMRSFIEIAKLKK